LGLNILKIFLFPDRFSYFYNPLSITTEASFFRMGLLFCSASNDIEECFLNKIFINETSVNDLKHTGE